MRGVIFDPAEMSFIRLTLLCCLGVCLASCVSEPLQERRDAARLEGRAASMESGGRPAYRVGSGDSLRVEHRFNDELNRVVVVRPDGFVTLPLIPDLRVSDLTIPEVRSLIEELYAGTVKTPRVTVGLENATNLKVFVGGEVLNPGMFTMSDGLTALRAVTLAGGPRPTGKMGGVVVLRDRGQGEPQFLLVDLDRGPAKLEGGQDFRLQPRDMVFVPKSTIATMNAFVDQYLNQLIPFSKNLGVTYFIGKGVY